MTPFDESYWDNRYKEGSTGWDIGTISTPLKEYFNQLKDTSLKILIPGGGLWVVWPTRQRRLCCALSPV